MKICILISVRSVYNFQPFTITVSGFFLSIFDFSALGHTNIPLKRFRPFLPVLAIYFSCYSTMHKCLTITVYSYLLPLRISGIHYAMPCTANTARTPTDSYNPGKSLCSCALLPCRFLKCGLSDVPPETDHLTGSRQPLPCL